MLGFPEIVILIGVVAAFVWLGLSLTGKRTS